MRSVIVALAMVGLILFFTSSMGSTLNHQLTCTKEEISSPSIGETSDARGIQSPENLPSNAGSSVKDSPDFSGTDRSLQNVSSDEQSQVKFESDPYTNSSAHMNPPDGRIFYDGGPPYAYIPTYTPKELGFPIIPLEPES